MSIFNSLGMDDRKVEKTVGVVCGVVTNNQDPDKLARIKITFPWLSDDNETDWVRMTTLMAGPQQGSFFLPEVGDEVLVAFEHGDMNHPYVIGVLWNGESKPPEDNSNGKNNIRKIKSRSGHEIVFDDNAEEKKEKLEIKTNAGHMIVLDDASGKEKIEVSSKSGHKIVMDDAPGGEKIEIADKSGNNKIVIDTVKKAIAVESGMEIKIKSTKVAVEASGSLDLKTDGILSIKGSLVKIN